MGILEALKYKVENGEQPKRTFYMAFGHDEEISGDEGAKMLSVELGKTLKVINYCDVNYGNGLLALTFVYVSYLEASYM